MMAAPLVSSPLGGRRLHAASSMPDRQAGPSSSNTLRPARFDIFDQPSSPRIEQADDLPAEFGDQSFGSSMSLGSSFDVGRRGLPTASPTAVSRPAGANIVASSSGSLPTPSPHGSPSTRHVFGTTVRVSPIKSPQRSLQDGLGAAMGTVLHSKTPGLAAKLSSPQPMDISPAPVRFDAPCPLSATPSKAYRRAQRGHSDSLSASSSNDRLPPGSAMKEDTPEHMRGQHTLPRRSTLDDESTPSLKAQTGSLSRLFGAELSLNQRSSSLQNKHASVDCVFGATSKPVSPWQDNSFDSMGSPDKEPPAKRRPASLPLSQSNFGARPSGSALPPFVVPQGAASHRRPSLLKSMTDGTALEESSRERKSSLDAIRQLHRSSDPALPTIPSLKLGRPSRSRPGSSEGRPERGSRERTTKSVLPTPVHATIIESPSPSKLADDQFAEYFLDPQSPEALRMQSIGRRQIATNAGSQQSLLGVASSSSRSMAPPRPRPLEKAASSANIPVMIGSSLGKRSNPYAKRPPFSQQNSGISVKSALAATGASSQLQLRPSIPRRCQSAMDNTAAFALGEDMSMSSADDGHNSANEESPEFKNRQGPLAPGLHLPPGFDAGGSPMASSSRSKPVRPSLFRKPSKDDSSPLGYGKRFTAASAVDAVAVEASPANRRPSVDTNMPGFGASEREGKILPCFSVKNDGLMRITPETMRNVLDGQYDAQIADYTVVDCRFAYEYQGGHIQGAVNLCTLEKVKQHFLQPADPSTLPLRSQSGKSDAAGVIKKKVVIFHCEFSQKRGPSSALALRQADRSLATDYPNCHYPELYVLDGGYAAFFKDNAAACDPPRYVTMDDPHFQQVRSRELNDFRKQFSRHRSFTFGDNPSMGRVSYSDGAFGGALLGGVSKAHAKENLKPAPAQVSEPLSIQEEDSSFDTSTSPSAVQAHAAVNRRRVLQRHATAGQLQLDAMLPSGGSNFLSERWAAAGRTQPFMQSSLASAGGRMLPPPTSKLSTTAPTTMEPPSPASSLGRRPILGSNGELAADLSFGSSIADSSPMAMRGKIITEDVPIATAADLSVGNDSSSSLDASGLCESPCAAAQTRSHLGARPAVWR